MVHVTNLLIPAVMLLPNLLFIAWPPTSMPELKDLKESLLHKTAEGIGRAGVVVLPLFSAVRVEGGFERIAIVLMLLSLGLYVFGWLRYLRGDRQYRLLYAPMLGIPVPMAIMPVLYFMSASLMLHSVPLLVCSLILGIGHIPASLRVQRFLDNHGPT